MSKKINKPLSVAMSDFRAMLFNCIKCSELPPCVMALIISDVYNQVNSAATEQYTQERNTYQTALNQCGELEGED